MTKAGNLVDAAMAGARRGNAKSYFDLGVFYSTGSHGVAVDMIEAHRWFNLAALAGDREAQQCRSDVSGEMTRPQIAEAQARARAWLNRARAVAPLRQAA